ncbi:MAG: ribonuclease H family protein [Lachnospiraceae bacterium]|nr:ribonuclease H family protein [Lachnospiraceae bacterium]
MAKKNFYAVKVGKTPGIYTTWEETKTQVSGYPGAVYKGFITIEEAKAYMGDGEDEGQISIFDYMEQGTEEVIGQGPDLDGDMPEAYAFTDGSYNIATKVYGYGGFIVVNGQERVLQGSGDDPELASGRNTAGEVMGAMAAIQEAIDMGVTTLTIYYDYEGVAKWATHQWKTNKPVSIQYVAYVDSVRDKIKVDFVHVKGHTGIPGNERADRLAKEAVGIE